MCLDEGPVDDVDDSWPCLRILGQKHCHKLLQVITVVSIQRLLRVLHNLEDQPEQILGVESVLESAQLIQDAAQGPDVRLIGIRLVLAYFRRHVVRRALHCERVVAGALQHLGDTEVPKFDSIILGQEYILRFEIPVKNLATMNILQ